MKIKFKKPDPRAGTVVQMDSSRGQHFIDSGSAVQVKDGDSDGEPTMESAAEVREAVMAEEKPAPAPKAKKPGQPKPGA